MFIHLCLTLWEMGYNIFILGNRPKTSSCWLPYQRHSSSADCARELFKGLNESASLVVCTRRRFFGWGLRIFCEWHHKWSSFGAILAHVAWPRAQPLGQSISLKFSMETRLESDSFEPLIDFLAFQVQKLWSLSLKPWPWSNLSLRPWPKPNCLHDIFKDMAWQIGHCVLCVVQPYFIVSIA